MSSRLLTDEEMQAAIAKGIEASAKAFRKFDEDAILYPESDEHYVRRAIAEAQEGKTRKDQERETRKDIAEWLDKQPWCSSYTVYRAVYQADIELLRKGERPASPGDSTTAPPGESRQ